MPSQDDAKPYQYQIPRKKRTKCLPQKIYDEFLIGLDKLKAELPEALEYKVVHKKAVTLRAQPSVFSDEIGRLQPGDSVKGWPVGPWLFVKESKTSLPDDGAWTMIDGEALGTGNLLMPEWSKLTVLESSATQMKFSWPGIRVSGMVYYLQWMPVAGKENRDGDVSITVQPSDVAKDATACVTGLPILGQVTFRVICRLEGGLLVGASDVLTTAGAEDTAEPVKPDLALDKEKLEEETGKYKDLVAQVKKFRDDSMELWDFKDIIHHMFKERPTEPDKAKKFVMTMLYGEEGIKKAKGDAIDSAEGAVQDMFGEATAGYEEGTAGACNQILADVIATLIRKHA